MFCNLTESVRSVLKADRSKPLVTQAININRELEHSDALQQGASPVSPFCNAFVIRSELSPTDIVAGYEILTTPISCG